MMVGSWHTCYCSGQHVPPPHKVKIMLQPKGAQETCTKNESLKVWGRHVSATCLDCAKRTVPVIFQHPSWYDLSLGLCWWGKWSQEETKGVIQVPLITLGGSPLPALSAGTPPTALRSPSTSQLWRKQLLRRLPIPRSSSLSPLERSFVPTCGILHQIGQAWTSSGTR